MIQEQIQRPMTKSSSQSRELARKLSKLTEVQAAVGWGLILLIVALLGVIYLNQSSRIAAVGRRVQVLRGQVSQIQRENTDIEREIAEAQSLERLQREAKEMGFVRSESFYVDYLVIPPFTSTFSPPAAQDCILSDAEQPCTFSQDTGNLQAVEPLPPAETIREALLLLLESTINNLMEGESGG